MPRFIPLFVASSCGVSPRKEPTTRFFSRSYYTSRPFSILASRQVSHVLVPLCSPPRASHPRSPSKRGTYFAPLFSRSWFQAGCALPALAMPSRFLNSLFSKRVRASAISSWTRSTSTFSTSRRFSTPTTIYQRDRANG